MSEEEAGRAKRRTTREKIPVRGIERINDFAPVELGYSQAQAVIEAQRCLQCKKPQCKLTCPIEYDIPQMVKFIAENDFASALNVAMSHTILAPILARVCPHPCETACVSGKKGDPIAIRGLKRAAIDFGTIDKWQPPERKTAASEKRIAVIGSGPAGLTVAYESALNGHHVTVFETFPVLGGTPAVGIPRFRLPQSIIDWVIHQLQNLGVAFKPNTRITSISSLMRDGYDAVFIGAGAHESRKMNVEGEELNGVIHANKFLLKVNLGEKVAVGNKVAVVGGGNVALDAVRTALRLGVSKAFIVYRRSLQEMPASPEEIEETQAEGVEIQFLALPVKIMGDAKGKVVGMECIKMKLGETDASGRRRPIPIEGSNYTIDVDNVIIAISQSPQLEWIKQEAGCNVELTKWCSVIVEENTCATKMRGVFAGGDAVRGPATIVDAIADGKRAANAIDKYLKSL